MLPRIGEHRAGDLNQRRTGRDRLQQRLEIPLDLILADRLAVEIAFALEAFVIAVERAASLRPRRRHRIAAAIAAHEAAQDEIIADIFARRGERAPVEAVLRLLPCGDADNRGVLARLHVNAEARHVDKPGIERISQDIERPLPIGLAPLLGAELSEAVEEARDLRRVLKTPRRETLEGFADDACLRLFGGKDLPAARVLLVAVPDDLAEAVEPVLDAGAHFLGDLPPVLLALQLTLRSGDGLEEAPFRAVFEIEVQAFARRTAMIRRRRRWNSVSRA
nr:hypothetical protein [Thalassobaculum salexigens]